MDDAYFVGSDALAEVVVIVGEFVAFGVALGFIAFSLGIALRALAEWIRVL